MPVTEILVRHYTPKYAAFAAALAQIIREETKFDVEEIDHTVLTLDKFVEVQRGDFVVSIDRYLAEKFGVPYVQCSRLFDILGNPVARRLQAPLDLPMKNICIIDTDICTGRAMDAAMRLLGASRFSVPLDVLDHQDLIDVEDLIDQNSLLVDGTPCNYLINQEFFARRTSLPREMYHPIKRLVQHYVETYAPM